MKKMMVKATPETVATCLVKRLMMHNATSVSVMRPSPIGISMPADCQVQGHAKFALPGLLVAKHQHGQALHGEAPHHAEGVGLAQHEDIAAAQDDGEELQAHDQIQDAIRGSEAAVRMAKPVRENAVFGDAVEDAVRAHDGGVDGAGQHQDADHDHESAERQPQQCSGPTRYIASPPIRLSKKFWRTASGMIMTAKNETPGGENQAVNENDEARFFQVAQLGMLDLAIDLGQGFLAAHGQHGVAEADQNADQSDGVGQRGVLQPAQRVVGVNAGSRGAATAEDERRAPRACSRTRRSS